MLISQVESRGAVATLQRVRMSCDEWLVLPDRPKAEWVDGEVIVTPHPSFEHQSISFALTQVLRTALPGLRPIQDVGLRLSGNRIRVPDVMVIERQPTEHSVDETPVLVAEILSPSTRSEDLIRKSVEYANAGIAQFWTVDPESRCIDVFTNNGRGWDLLARPDAQQPTAEVVVGQHGSVPLDLDTILGG